MIKKYPFQILASPPLDVSYSRAPGGRSGSTILATWSWGEGPEGPTAEGLEEQGGHMVMMVEINMVKVVTMVVMVEIIMV